MSILVNKFMTVTFRMSRQYSYNIKKTNFKAENLIQILLLQATIQSKIKLIANISCHTKKLLTVSIRNLCFQTFSSSVSLYYIVVSISARRIQVFSVWSKIFKNSIHSTNKYLINFVKNWKRISHLSCTRIKFWKKQIMCIYFIKK